MIFILLHIIFAEVIILYITNIDSPVGIKGLGYKPENKVLFLVSNIAMLFFSFLFFMFAKNYLLSFFVRISVLLCALAMVHICVYYLQFAGCIGTVGAVIFKIIAFIVGFILLFLRIHDIEFSYDEGFLINALPVLSDEYGYQNITWFVFAILLFDYVMPLLCSLVVITKLIIKRQTAVLKQSLLMFLTFFIPWISIYLMNKYILVDYPFAWMAFYFMIIGLQALFIKRTAHSDINAFNPLFFFANILEYIIPAVLFSLIYITIYPMYESNKVLFYILFVTSTLVILIGTKYFGEFVIKTKRRINRKYDKKFENELKAISYEEEKQSIEKKFSDIIRRNLRTSSMAVLENVNSGNLNYIYCEKDPSKEGSLCIQMNGNEETAILNFHSLVIRKTDLENVETFGSNRVFLKRLFEITKAQAFVTISSKNHLDFIILLSQKVDNSKYNKYDISTVTKLYSYFFIFTYYLKNVAIQGNSGGIAVDKSSVNEITNFTSNNKIIVNDKYDVGTLFKPAAISTGDFLDIINMNSTRQLFIIGNISGRGFEVSISAILLRATIRAFIKETKDFKALVCRVNEYICNEFSKGIIFYGLFAIIDYTTDTMYYINCGIPSVAVFNKDLKRIIEVKGSGHMLGFVNDISKYISVKKVHINKGDIVFTYTEGIIDSTSVIKTYAKQNKLQELLLANTIYSSERIAKFIYDDFVSVEEIDDDVSMIVIKRSEKV